MSSPARTTLVEQAREAAGRGAWQEAFDLLTSADAQVRLSGPDLPFFAAVAYAAGDLDRTIEAWERAHTESLRGGDRVAAAGAAVRVAMHLLFDTALMAPVRGWLKRVERLLEDHDETPVHAWLFVVKSYERLLSGDFVHALESARQAIAIGVRHDPAAAAVARVAEARSLILDGHVSEGLLLLHEAGVATASGELDPLLTGVVYCELVCALQGIAQYDLAEEWTIAMETWRHGQPIGSVHGRCRIHRAEILRLRGSWSEAEQHALAACEELRPYLRREFGWPLMELGRIRLRRGDIAGAEAAFRSAHEVGWDPQPGLALVHLAKGDVARATDSIRDALENPLAIPSKELPPHTELRQAPLFEAQSEIAVAAGDLALAQIAAAELARIAALFESKPLTASAALAYGRIHLASGDTAGACRDFGQAAHLWNEVGAPYETALARIGLGYAHRAIGNESRAVMEFEAARAAFGRLGALREETEAARALTDSVAEDTPARPSPAPTRPAVVLFPGSGSAATTANVFRSEGDYWLLGFDGHTVRLRDQKGLHYLARLLGAAGREFHALDLVAVERSPDIGDAGVMLDPPAKEAYRRRLAEIDEDIEEARRNGDGERAAQATTEREFLAREIGRAVGLGGRDRRASSDSERARASVTRAIRQAMTRIQEHHPRLGEHLDRTIRTGTTCGYLPDPRMSAAWKV
jgi:tetratricopeptide (TPR) repeat protein